MVLLDFIGHVRCVFRLCCVLQFAPRTRSRFVYMPRPVGGHRRFVPYYDLGEKSGRQERASLESLTKQEDAEPVATAQRGPSSVLRMGIVLRVTDLNRWARP
jgi:hypothetical protein